MKFTTLSAKLMLAVAFLLTGLVTSQLAPQPAHAAISFATTTRTAMMQSIVTDAGSGAKLKLYNGCTTPTGASAATGCTLLATLTWSGTIGTATGGTIDWDESGAAQTNSAHVAGTPTFAHITTSGDVVKARIDICNGSNAPCWTFTGAVANGQNITLTGLFLTASNP